MSTNVTLNPTLETMDVENAKQVSNPVAKSRKIRDILFQLVFYGFLASLIALAGMGYQKGDPHSLLFGLDYRGRICDEKELVGFKAKYWVNLGQLVSVVMQSPQNFYDAKSLCLKSCPVVNAATTENWTKVNFVCNYPDGYGRTAQFPDPTTTGK